MNANDLKKMPIFGGLNPAQVNNLICNVRKVRYKKDTLICNFSEKFTNIYVIIQGSVKILSKSGDVLGILHENEVFNEIGFVYELPCCTSFIATEDTNVFIISKTLIKTLSKEDSAIKTIILKNVLLNIKNKSASIDQSVSNKTNDFLQSNGVTYI